MPQSQEYTFTIPETLKELGFKEKNISSIAYNQKNKTSENLTDLANILNQYASQLGPWMRQTGLEAENVSSLFGGCRSPENLRTALSGLFSAKTGEFKTRAEKLAELIKSETNPKGIFDPLKATAPLKSSGPLLPEAIDEWCNIREYTVLTEELGFTFNDLGVLLGQGKRPKEILPRLCTGSLDDISTYPGKLAYLIRERNITPRAIATKFYNISSRQFFPTLDKIVEQERQAEKTGTVIPSKRQEQLEWDRVVANASPAATKGITIGAWAGVGNPSEEKGMTIFYDYMDARQRKALKEATWTPSADEAEALAEKARNNGATEKQARIFITLAEKIRQKAVAKIDPR